MFENFKNLIRRGDKFIVIEDGKPAYVVMHYEDYEGMLARRPSEHAGSQQPHTAQSPQQPNFVPKAQQDFRAGLAMDASNLPEDLSKIRLEDLPL